MIKESPASRWEALRLPKWRKMSKGAALLLCILPVLLLCSCRSHRELNKLAIVVGAALDVGEEPDTVHLTAQVVKPSEMGGKTSSGSKSGEKAYVNITYTDKSVLSAVRGITHMQNRRLYFAHNDVLIFSSELAKLDLAEGLDVFIRDYEARLNAYLMVSKGNAAQILEEDVELEKAPALHISGMMENQKANSETVIITMRDFVIATLSEATAPVAPMVELTESGGHIYATLNGTAVFKQEKMIGELDKAQTRGLLTVTNKATSSAMTVDTEWGQVVLEVLSVKSKLKPVRAENGGIRMKLSVNVLGALQSNETFEEMSSTDKVQMLKGKMKERFLGDIENALATARELSADIFGFGDAIRRDYPDQWDRMKESWEEKFPEIELDSEIEITLGSTGGLARPVAPGGAK